MIKSIRNYLADLITSGIEGTFEVSEVRKAALINLFSFLGLLSLFVFGIRGIIQEKWTYSLILITFFGLILGNLIHLRKRKNFKISSNLVVLLMLLLEFALFSFLGEGTTGLYWFYVFPLLAFFLTGLRVGMIYIGIIFAFAVVFLKQPLDFMTIYPEDLHVRFLFTLAIVSALTFVFEFVRARTSVALQKADKQKTHYLTQTLQQKEEILVQSEQLKLTNKELEKLSVVASETTNAVLIANVSGELEWVNAGFTRLYGYTIEDLNDLSRDSIFAFYDSPKIRMLVKNCIEKHASCSYETVTETKEGERKWVQTTVTPILDDDHKVRKLIAIDTDISLLKEAEQELLQRQEEITTQKDELEQQNKQLAFAREQIEGSIRYAETIQRAILPQDSRLKPFFEYFLVYLPRDIVSGDFYWFSNQPASEQQVETCYYAVVDCTGHGVPGAFMSMIGNRALNNLINEKQIESPAAVLEGMNDRIINALNQNDNTNQDGMDLGLIKIETLKNGAFRLTYAGAKRPVYIWHQQSAKLVEYKGSRKSIGGNSARNSITFEETEIRANSGDIIYLSSDGFIDQNDADRKKFGSREFVKLLEQVATKSLVEQKRMLKHRLVEHADGQPQRDDITVWGIKL